MDAVRQMILWKKRAAAASAVATPLLDTYSGAHAAYSPRKLRTAYAGSCMRIRRSSDSTTQDIGFIDIGDGSLWVDKAAIATFIGGGTGSPTILYDQSGNGRNISFTGTAPLFLPSDPAAGNRPAIDLATLSSLGWFNHAVSSSASGATAATVITVGSSTQTDSAGRAFGIIGETSGGVGVGVRRVGSTGAARLSISQNTVIASSAGKWPSGVAKTVVGRFGLPSNQYSLTIGGETVFGTQAFTLPSSSFQVGFWSGDTQWYGMFNEYVLYLNNSVDHLGIITNCNTAFNLT